MILNIIRFNFLALFVATFCFAELIKDITIKGNQRLSKESILLFGELDINKNYEDSDLNSSLKKLYETNFFKKISLTIKNNILIVDVLENPIIESLEINGIKNKSFLSLLEDQMILKSRKSYVESVFLQDVNQIKNVLKRTGYYFSKVETSFVKNDTQNSIRLSYDIDLGKKAQIKEIIFIGDKKFKDRKLRNVITSEVSQPWKFLSRKQYIDEKRIELDKRLLLGYYKNRGFYSATIEDSFLEFSDNNSFKLIYKINAGNKFTFEKVSLDIPADYDIKYFAPINDLLLKLKDELYSLGKIEKILNEIDKVALSKQYDFIDAIINEKIIQGNKLEFIITIKETEKYYVEKINIYGNNITQEEVIRNSFIIDEGDPYNKILFNKSLNKIRAKNIFGNVKSTMKDGSDQNLKIIDIEVQEKATGEISLGAGVGSSGGNLGAGIKENNFLGKGITLDTNLSISAATVKGKLVLVKPNFNYSDNTLFTSIESTSTDNMVVSGYKTNLVGFSLGTNFQQYENLFFSPEIETTFETLKTSTSAAEVLKKQKGDYFDLYFNYGLDYDLRNRPYQPSQGYRTSFSQKIPIESKNYEIINSFDIKRYFELPAEMVAKISFLGKAVNSMNGNDVRVSKRLYMPGNRLRGFEQGKVGPVENNDFVGGNYVSAFNLSTTLPQILPSLQAFDFSVFIDAGNVWGVDYNDKLNNSNKIRSATGVNMDVITPIGPMNFSLSQPITKGANDVEETFRFSIGTTF